MTTQLLLFELIDWWSGRLMVLMVSYIPWYILGCGERDAAETVGTLLALLLAERKHHHGQQSVLLELLHQALPLTPTEQTSFTR